MAPVLAQLNVHSHHLCRRSQWFPRWPRPSTVCWWHDGDGRRQVDEALRRLALLRAHGPRPDAFGLATSSPQPAPADEGGLGGG